MEKQYFGTDGVRGGANIGKMTPDNVMRLGMAAGKYFRNGDTRRHSVVIGKDTRLSGYMIESALVAGFSSVGMDVKLFGPLPTSGVSLMARTLRADLGVMITASHNSFGDNGIKFFGPDGCKLCDEAELAIEDLMHEKWKQGLARNEDLGRVVRYEDVQARYIEIVKSTFPKKMRLDGMRIVVSESILTVPISIKNADQLTRIFFQKLYFRKRLIWASLWTAMQTGLSCAMKRVGSLTGTSFWP